MNGSPQMVQVMGPRARTARATVIRRGQAQRAVLVGLAGCSSWSWSSSLSPPLVVVPVGFWAALGVAVHDQGGGELVGLLGVADGGLGRDVGL